MTNPDPLPSLEALQAYEKLVPGSALRLTEVFAQVALNHPQALARKQEMEFELHKREMQLQMYGQVFAFVITMTALCGGIYIATNGSPWPGALLSGSTILAIVLAFIKTRKAPAHFADSATQPPPSKSSKGASSKQ
jgi:uncharacterized membrane protein